MKNKTFLFVAIFTVSLFIIPQVTLASWWNPGTWKIFNRKYEVKIERAIIATSTFDNRIVQVEKATTTLKIEQKSENAKNSKETASFVDTNKQKNDQFKEIEKLKKEIEVLKEQIEKQSNISSKLDIPPANITPSNIVFCNGKNWTICPTGQKFYCPSTGDAQCLIENVSNQNNRNNLTQNQQISITSPTMQQISNLRRFCLSDSFINSVCQDYNFMPGYYSNENFRLAIDDLIKQYDTILSNQQKQKIAAEKQISDCIMAATPENERILDPATQNYLRQVRCGTVTDVDRTNYELSRIKSSADELKYRLDQKISFPSLYLDPIKAPTFTNPQWQIRWNGSGGSITDSSGNFYQFHCEDNTCRSY